MDSVRDGEHFLTTAHLVTWLKSYKPEWLAAYMASKNDDDQAYKSLLVQWCLRFANRHSYHHRVPCPAKQAQTELLATQETFSDDFNTKFGHLPRHAWFNVDETPVYYKTELPTYPEGPVYAVQKNAYMNQRIWSLYLREVLKPDIDCPSVVLADNLKCHVSSKSYKIMEDELFCGAYLHPLPANTTRILQPLDVGVMGPLKKMCRTEWIKEEKLVTAAEKRLAMIKRSIKVWNDMKQETVRKSFEKALNISEI
ncbi:hypothetical protein DYB32_009613 [Aphanomyces invadans]|uniref:DDE-1 domain-containing protein n=1 Tax=Aphanomyces invadans TaxID=157072 RepID=A0A3R6V3W4_9STRA|nr:hypothetical protein DYB32_009613 [Aphanomyces invadans]